MRSPVRRGWCVLARANTMGTTSSGDHYSTTRNKNKVTKVSADAISEACQHCESNVEIEVQKADKNESNAYTEYTAMCFCDIYHGLTKLGVSSPRETVRNVDLAERNMH